jgi:hypothetical protein
MSDIHGSSQFVRVLGLYTMIIFSKCLVSGQRAWADVTRVAKSCARRLVSLCSQREGIASIECDYLICSNYNHVNDVGGP